MKVKTDVQNRVIIADIKKKNEWQYTIAYEIWTPSVCRSQIYPFFSPIVHLETGFSYSRPLTEIGAEEPQERKRSEKDNERVRRT